MDQECPKCGMISPSGTRYCDCGYDFVAQQVDRHRAPKTDSSPSVFAVYQGLRLGIAGLCCGIAGIGLLMWELSEANPSFWGIARSGLIAIVGFGLLGMIVYLGTRPRA